jgi:hypothetical protein
MQFISKEFKTCLIFLLSIQYTLSEKFSRSHLSTHHKRSHYSLELKLNKLHRKLSVSNHHVDFILGLATGYGLNAEATEDLKNCFKSKEENHHLVSKFFTETKTISISKRAEANSAENDKKENATSFVKSAVDMFGKLKDCPAFKETIFSFLKNRLLSLGIKGIAYVVAGPIGILIKGAYDFIKLWTEISNFYSLQKSKKKDYMQLGSCVGRIIYYTQNLIARRRRRRF